MMRPDLESGKNGRMPFPWLAVVVVMVAVIAMNLAPDSALNRLRFALRESAVPGLKFVRTVRESIPSGWPLALTLRPSHHEEAVTSRMGVRTGDESNSSATVETTIVAQEVRRAELELLQLQNELGERKRLGKPPGGATSETLFIPELIEARWLGEEAIAAVKSQFIIDRGSESGIHEPAIVLQGKWPLIDLGDGFELEVGDPVYSGRVVVGRIAAVGNQISSVRRVNDSGYTDRVRIARRSERGMQILAEGILEGTGGDTCRLKHVEEAVSEGDLVFTAAIDGVIQYPMYYGRISKAIPRELSAEWEIEVEPAAIQVDPTTVAVLRFRRNPARNVVPVAAVSESEKSPKLAQTKSSGSRKGAAATAAGGRPTKHKAKKTNTGVKSGDIETSE